jgi:3-oxoacyl-[acyl-carrier-protein] synthase II
MRKPVYIKSMGLISAQKTFERDHFLQDVEVHTDTVIPAKDPVYKEYIPPAAARRMAKGIKMGVVASQLALSEAGIDQVDAIITGTGMGCLRDSEKFVSAIIDNDEQFLTPTSFIQSTHNTVGGQIALGMDCKGYNFTYVHASNSFESALLDAKMQLELNEAADILVGGVDELADHTVKIHRLIGHVKQKAVSSDEVLVKKTKGAVFSEGASFFVVTNTENEDCYAELRGLQLMNTLKRESVNQAAIDFLAAHGLEVSQIDALILGTNGDSEYDEYYDQLISTNFDHIPHIYYKHLVGEYNTVSAFGMALGAQVLKTGEIPQAFQNTSTSVNELSTILLYNQYRGENHSFVLLQKC